jgi:CheY-like chemotaxis protein
VSIDSRLGKGTTVRLRFVPAPARPLLVPAAILSAPPRLRILVVDDDPVLLDTLREVLEADGHDVVIADGGQQGIDAIQAAQQGAAQFAVIITDLGMPHVDGRKVASAAKALSPATPVVLLTGWGQRLEFDGEALPQVDRVLGKPPKLAELREVLIQLCAPTNA